MYKTRSADALYYSILNRQKTTQECNAGRVDVKEKVLCALSQFY